jgi:transposase
VLLLKDEDVLGGELAGDGTGYVISVKYRYRAGPQKHGKKFVHFFTLFDLSLGVYVGCGLLGVSEVEVLHKVLVMLRQIAPLIHSLRLGKCLVP